MNHDQSYDEQTESFDECPATAFVYETVYSHSRITTVYCESWTWNGQAYGGSATYQETALSLTYGTTVNNWWQVVSETEWPNTGDARTHNFVHVDNGTSGSTTWTDPLGVERVYEWNEWPNVPAWEGHPALKRKTFRVTRIPREENEGDPRPWNDPSYNGPLSWQFTWDRLRVTTIQGPYAVDGAGESPPSDPLTVFYTYDGAGRGLITRVDVVAEGGASTLTRAWTYEDWSEPWSGATTKRKDSRLRSYTDGRGNTWDYVFNENTLQTTILHPLVDGMQARMQQVITEDALGRVTVATEPVFAVTVTTLNTMTVSTSTSDGRTEFTYGTTWSSPSYGLLTGVRQYRGLGHTDPVDLTVDYGGVGLVKKVTEADGSADEREHGLAYDGGMRLRYIYLPDPSTGAIPGTPSDSNWSEEVRHDALGRVTCGRLRALKANGTAYTKNFITRWRWYDRAGRPIKQQLDRAPLSDSNVDPLVMTTEWDAAGRLSAVKGPIHSGNAVSETQYQFDDHGMLYKIRRLLVAGTWSEEKYGYYPTGAVKRTEDATGFAMEYDPDGFGRIVQAHILGVDSEPNPDDRTVQYTLDDEGAITETTFFDDTTILRRVEYLRDVLGRLTDEKVYDGTPSLLAWNTTAYNGLSFVSATREKLLEATLGARGQNYKCDTMGAVTAIEDTLSSEHGNRVQIVRNDAGDIIQRWYRQMRESDQGGIDHTWSRSDYAYDRRSQLTSVKRLAGLTVNDLMAEHNFTYDRLGQVVERQDRQLDATSTWRDWTKWTWEHDALGRELSETVSPNYAGTENPIALQMEYTDIPLDQGQLHTTLGFVFKRTDGRGNETTYYYDRGGRLVERRAPGYTAQSSAFRWLHEYDNAGRMTAWVDGHNARIEIVYDDLTKLVKNRKVVSNYSHLSFMTTWEDWGYDQFDRITDARTRYLTFQSASASTLVTSKASRDPLGRIQSEEYEWRGASPAPAVVSSSWTVSGGLADPLFRQQITTASGWDLHYHHDNGGRLTSMRIQSPVNNSTLEELAAWRYEGFQALGRKVYTTTGTANYFKDTLTYDGLRQLTGILSTWGQGGATTLVNDTITRDWLGNVLSVQYRRISAGAGDRFKLDGFDRLTEAKLGVPSNEFSCSYASASYGDRKIEWALDPAHNRTSVVVTAGGSATTISYGVSGTSNHYTAVDGENFVYDSNGNLVFDGDFLYKYDYLDRLCEVYYYDESAEARSSRTQLTLAQVRALLDVAAERYRDINPAEPGWGKERTPSKTLTTGQAILRALYAYDPYNRRVLEYVHEDVLSYWTAWDGWRRTDECTDNGMAFTKYRTFFDGDGIDEHLGYAVTADNGTSWTRYTYLQGHQGHVRAVIDANGNVVELYEYDPYGARSVYDSGGTLRPNGTAVHNDYGYTGRRHDDRIDAGLVYYRNRHYHPRIGRFLTYDPIGIWGDANEWGNGYSYVADRPTTGSDPLGLVGLLRPNGTEPAPDTKYLKYWNSDTVRTSNNCYSYAFNDTEPNSPNSKPEPGKKHGNSISSLGGYSEAKIADRIKKDVDRNNREIEKEKKAKGTNKSKIVFVHLKNCEKICDCGTYKVYAKWGWIMVSKKGQGSLSKVPDFHFYRQHRDGTWSHKPGHGEVRTGVKDPRKDNYELKGEKWDKDGYKKKGKYDKFGGCYCISNSGMDVK